jgi:hypothetical protein
MDGSLFPNRSPVNGPLVAIDHKGRILIGFAAHDNAGLATREHPGLSFHILRFSPGGKLDRTLLVPTKEYYGNGLYLGPKARSLRGNFTD